MPQPSQTIDPVMLRAYQERQIDNDVRKAAGLEPNERSPARFYAAIIAAVMIVAVCATILMQAGTHAAVS